MATIFGGSRLANLREKRTSGDEGLVKSNLIMIKEKSNSNLAFQNKNLKREDTNQHLIWIEQTQDF